MEISYKRTHKESYMIISTEEYVSDYEEQMLKENEIRSLLSFYTMEMNGRIQFWYDISGKQSLKDYLPHDPRSSGHIPSGQQTDFHQSFQKDSNREKPETVPVLPHRQSPDTDTPCPHAKDIYGSPHTPLPDIKRPPPCSHKSHLFGKQNC